MRHAVIEKLKGRPYLADFDGAVRRGGIERPAHGAAAHGRRRWPPLKLRAANSIPSPASTTPGSRAKPRSRPGAARSRAVQRPDQGQLLRMPSQHLGRRRHPAAVHRFQLRQSRRSAQHSRFRSNGSATAPAYTPINSDDGITDLLRFGHLRSVARQRHIESLQGFAASSRFPTLRNIALTAPYFHNGRFTTLSKAIGFYVRRDTNPEQFYPTAPDGRSRNSTICRRSTAASSWCNIICREAMPAISATSTRCEIPYNRRIGRSAGARSPMRSTT